MYNVWHIAMKNQRCSNPARIILILTGPSPDIGERGISGCIL
jgi:hypothetical protein